MVKIAECGGYELFEDGPRILFVHRPTGAYPVALFVLGLLTFILAANAVLQLAMSASGGGSVLLGFVLLAVAIGAGVLIAVLLKMKRAKEALPIDGFVTLALDRAQRAVLDASGRPLAPLEGVIFRPAFQIASSSRALEICYGGQAHVIARGSPFAGSVESFTEVLQQRGFRVS